jgi:hypothetical protein
VDLAGLDPFPETDSLAKAIIFRPQTATDHRSALAVPADVDSILLFWKEAAEDSNRPTDTREAVDRLIRRDADALVLVTNDDSIVGSLVGRRF